MNKKINDPNIFQLHQEIIKLLAIRLEYAVCDKIEESPTGHKNSKSEILEEIKRYSEVFSILDGTFLEKIFLLIESHSSEAKNKHAPLIGFQGEHGAFSEMATRRYNSKLIPIPCQSFADVFEGVETGTFDLGIVPVENSLGGTVTQVNELLIRTSLKIVGGIRLKISHSLMTLPETDYRDLRVVYSHPQALSQCRGFLGRHKLEGRPYYDTAGAARMLAKDRPAMTAVVAGRLCADLYNLEILKENIQDYCPNYTRFLILSREESKETADKCSIIFSTQHRAGSLFDVLRLFAEADINLTRIESLPFREDPGNYVFFCDFQIKGMNSTVRAIIDKIRASAKMVKTLGCYPEIDDL